MRDAAPAEGLGRRGSEHDATIAAVLPWLGVPVLVSAALARSGHGLPGEILPVVAFLPLLALVLLVAVRLPAPRRAWALALPGWGLVAGLLAYIGSSPGPGAVRTFAVALAATLAGTALAWFAGRRKDGLAALASTAGLAMVFAQGLDGWLTYLAVANPFGWLDHPVAEQVFVSRLLLEVAAPAYPALKVGLAVAVAMAFRAGRMGPTTFVGLVLLVCYLGLSPAMFSAANLLG